MMTTNDDEKTRRHRHHMSLDLARDELILKAKELAAEMPDEDGITKAAVAVGLLMAASNRCAANDIVARLIQVDLALKIVEAAKRK